MAGEPVGLQQTALNPYKLYSTVKKQFLPGLPLIHPVPGGKLSQILYLFSHLGNF